MKDDLSPNEIIEAHQRRVEEMAREELIELAPHEDAMEFWDKVMRSPHQPMQRRMSAAKERAQYRYPKLGVMATTNMSTEDFATMLDRAIARSQVGLKVIEHHKDEGEKDEGKSAAPLPPQAHWPTPRSAKSRRF
jgi:hypothetical protein